MTKLYEFDPWDLPALLAGDRARVYDPQQAAAPGNIPPNQNRRTILIGLGGMGVKTLDRIKAAMQAQLQPGWEQFVGLLAVDTDRHDLAACGRLRPAETLCLSRPGLPNTVNAGPNAWPRAWHAIADAGTVMAALGHPGIENGTCAKRLVGRLKLHDQAPGQPPFDRQVVDRLTERAFGAMMPFVTGVGTYDVYVIGSLCGGTGSGMLLDLPVLIRQALNAHEVNIHAIAYHPDVFTGLAPGLTDQHRANAYAALKELDHYQGLPTRQGCQETWPYDEPALPVPVADGQTGLFRNVWLVGADFGAGTDPWEQAMETVCVHLIQEVADYAPPMIPAPAAPAGSVMGLSCARAALPLDNLRAYVIGRVCKDAGMMPVSPEEYASLAAAGMSPLPWQGKDQYPNATVLNVQTKQLLQPLIQWIDQFYGARPFSYEAVFGHKPTWEEILSGEADHPMIRKRIDVEVEWLTGPEAERQLRSQMEEQFQHFRTAAQQYVAQYGPMAFVNLFHGCGLDSAQGEVPMGIRKVLQMLREGVDVRTGIPLCFPDLEVFDRELQEVTQQIQSDGLGQLQRVRMSLFPGRCAELTAHWLHSYEALVNARIAQRRRKMLLGNLGILCEYFLHPAELLAEQLHTFGTVLETMTGIYANHGAALEDFHHFRSHNDRPNTVNIGGLLPEAHQELRQRMDMFARTVNPMAVRTGLVWDFFQDPSSWMEVEESHIRRANRRAELRYPDRPVAARYAFDRIMDNLTGAIPAISVADLFQMAANNGVSDDEFAYAILTELAHLSGSALPHMGPGANAVEVVFPHEIHMNHPNLAGAVVHGAQSLFPVVSFRLSYDNTEIVLCRHAEPLVIPGLLEHPRWEAAYAHRLQIPGSGLRCFPPR